jgi:hypothetical protein
MSERLKKLIGDDLYSEIEKKAKEGNVKIKDIDIIPNNYVPINRFNEVNNDNKIKDDKIQSYETQQKDLEKMLKGVNAENLNDLMNNFNKMTENHKVELEKKDLEITNYKKSTMIKEYLTNQGAKHTDLLMKSINLDDIKIDGNQLIGISDITKSLKESYKELFIEKTTNTNKPPKNTDNNNNNNNDDSGNNIFSSLLSGGSL